MTESYRRFIREHPEKHPNVIMAQRGFMSSIERKMKDLLDRAEIPYEAQYPVLQFFVDFALPSLKIAIECDGDYWHKQQPKRDQRRQRMIEGQGWTVVRFSEREINERLDSVEEKVLRIAANHSGQYRFMPCKVLSVQTEERCRTGTLYNLSVQEDESFVAKGIIVHNCRCVLLAQLSEKGLAMLEAVEKGGPGSGNFGHRGGEGGPGNPGGSTADGGPSIDDRAARATASYKPMTAAILAKAHEMEAKVAAAVRGRQLPDNEPFDVVQGKNVFEVKTIVRGKNPKITMHPESLARKVDAARKTGAKTHTVVVDIRGGRLDVYYKEGLGSFRLKNMEKLSGWAELRRRVG